jgi:hypothetical protein
MILVDKLVDIVLERMMDGILLVSIVVLVDKMILLHNYLNL